MNVVNWVKSIYARIFGYSNQPYMHMLNIILFGPPGSGKGTQAAKLVEKYNLLHISTGDLFRYEMGNNTELGLKAKEYMSKGMLVPDEVTIGMLKNKVESNLDAAGFIFDGFPRTIPQAKALDAYLTEKGTKIQSLLSLQVNDDEIVKRLLLRGESSGRADDMDESIIRKRIEVYKSETQPVFDYYDKASISKNIHGIGSIDDIFERLCNSIDGI
jgi:adenylate kinase